MRSFPSLESISWRPEHCEGLRETLHLSSTLFEKWFLNKHRCTQQHFVHFQLILALSEEESSNSTGTRALPPGLSTNAPTNSGSLFLPMRRTRYHRDTTGLLQPRVDASPRHINGIRSFLACEQDAWLTHLWPSSPKQRPATLHWASCRSPEKGSLQKTVGTRCARCGLPHGHPARAHTKRYFTIASGPEKPAMFAWLLYNQYGHSAVKASCVWLYSH